MRRARRCLPGRDRPLQTRQPPRDACWLQPSCRSSEGRANTVDHAPQPKEEGPVDSTPVSAVSPSPATHAILTVLKAGERARQFVANTVLIQQLQWHCDSERLLQALDRFFKKGTTTVSDIFLRQDGGLIPYFSPSITRGTGLGLDRRHPVGS